VSKEQDAAFVRNFVLVLAALGAFTFVIILMANLIGEDEDDLSDRDPLMAKAVEARIEPVGKVNVAGQATAGEGSETPLTGKEVVQKFCFACHGTGAAGAPKIGDKAAWQPRVMQGYTVLMQHAIYGFKGMPAKGGNPALSDEQIREAIALMLKDSGLEMPQDGGSGQVPAEDKEPVAAAPTPAPAPAPAPAAAASAPAAEAAPAASGAADLANGKAVYTKACFACHGTGAAGAPKLGDKAAWAPRIAQGEATLDQHAIHGFKAMPPKGGNPALSNQDVMDAVAYLVSEGK
jgi:cytochrome c5